PYTSPLSLHDALPICLIKCERRHRMRRVFTDAGKQLHLLDGSWELSRISICYNFCSRAKISRPGVVTKALPGVEHFALRRARESGEIRKSLQPFLIIRQDSADLGLLKHEFGN